MTPPPQFPQALLVRMSIAHNYVTTALRTLRTRPGFATISVIGLAVGIAASLLIGQHVLHAWSYDRFHENADRIGRIVRTAEGAAATTAAPLAPLIGQEVPSVETAVRMYLFANTLVHPEPDASLTSRLLVVEEGFFELFSFEVLQGSVKGVLAEPSTAILTASTAKRYFGTTDVVGRTLEVETFGGGTRTVRAVVADPPPASHLQFDLLGSFAVFTQAAFRTDNWQTNWLYTYLLFRYADDLIEADEQIETVVAKHVDQYPSVSVQPLLDVHLHSAHFTADLQTPGNASAVHLLAILAVLILGVAGVNYVNFSTARATRRAPEIGIRKALGAGRPALLGQMITETLVWSLAALLLGIGLALMAGPRIAQWTGLAADTSPVELPIAIGLLASLWLLVGLASGAYPAWILSRYQPQRVLRSQVDAPGGFWLRKVLVAGQLVVSMALLLAAIVVQQQLAHLQTQHLGQQVDPVVLLPLGDGADLDVHGAALRQELQSEASIQAVSITGSVPGEPLSDFRYHLEGQPDNAFMVLNTFFGDAHTIDVLGLSVVDGRGFRSASVADSVAFVLNEAAVQAAVRAAGPAWHDPVGKALTFQTPQGGTWTPLKTGRVVGVVENFAYGSLREPVAPLVLQVLPFTYDHALVQIDANRTDEALTALRDHWAAFSPDPTFRYFFLDERFAQLYETDRRVGMLFQLFAGLAAVIAVLGLLGLTAYTAARRRQEIGVRKVLGATVGQVITLLSREYLLLSVLAFALAAPLAYIGLTRWLTGFAVQTPLTPLPFVAAGFGITLLVLFTVGIQAARAATTDPATTLRSE